MTFTRLTLARLTFARPTRVKVTMYLTFPYQGGREIYYISSAGRANVNQACVIVPFKQPLLDDKLSVSTRVKKCKKV